MILYGPDGARLQVGGIGFVRPQPTRPKPERSTDAISSVWVYGDGDDIENSGAAPQPAKTGSAGAQNADTRPPE
jgi:hypothetical protein